MSDHNDKEKLEPQRHKTNNSVESLINSSEYMTSNFTNITSSDADFIFPRLTQML